MDRVAEFLEERDSVSLHGCLADQAFLRPPLPPTPILPTSIGPNTVNVPSRGIYRLDQRFRQLL
jgi:hypothetical protein